jgi:hypothetical protein
MPFVKDEELAELREAQEKLNALEAGGVDNWDGYDFAMEPIRKREENKKFLESIVGEIFEVAGEHIEEPAGHGCGYGIGQAAYDTAIAVLEKNLAKLKELA